jgi:mediator of RNA polymerase II transcription subunit 16
VAHQVSGSLRLFRININWNQPATEQKDVTQGQPSASPSLDVSALLEEGACYPSSVHESTSTSNLEGSVPYQLSNLELIPVAPREGTREPTQAMIMATFTIMPSPGVLIEPSNQYQQASSIIARWSLRKGLQDKLAPCFEQLSAKKKSGGSATPRVCNFCLKAPGQQLIMIQQRVRLQRLPDVSFDSVILASISLRNNTMFSFSMSDGTIQFRYRDTMDVITPDDNYNEVHTMPQSGFAFPTMDPCTCHARLRYL